MHNSRRDSSLLTYRGLELFHQSVRSLHEKLNLITVLLCGTDIDLLSLSKIHTKSTDSYKIFSTLGYHYISKSRTTGTSGGVSLYFSDKHDFVRRKDLELTEIESIWIEIRIKKSKNILLHTTYRLPDSPLHLTDNFANVFGNMFSTASKKNIEIILMGDLNIVYLNNTDHRKIKDIFLHDGLTQIIKSPTCYDLHHNSSCFKFRPKLCGNCVFPQNFHTKKLGEITVFYAVYFCEILLLNLQRSILSNYKISDAL